MRFISSQLISSKGYPVAEHVVQTKDGFILALQRIPYGRKAAGDYTGKKTAVFLQHGLLSAASDFVFNFPEQSLGFLLADSGYDVWLGNTRGNTYSRRHTKLKPDTDAFWDFSFDEMGAYDLPAMIDYVLNVTHQDQLAYIGHSQGTTAAFALLSESPEYNKKLKVFIALAPVASGTYITNVLRYLAPISKDLELLAKYLGIRDFLPNNKFMKFLSEYLCKDFEKVICENAMFLFFGRDYKEMNVSRIGVYGAHSPAGSSVRSIVHFGQMIETDFAKFDFGKKENIARYGQAIPPKYNISAITTPVALISGLNDNLADPVDVAIVAKQLNSLVSNYIIPLRDFNHIDFVTAIHGKELIFDEVQRLLLKYAR
ncbi:gastric triacylglycerol lipase [Trichonephila clavata]|uniref:Lipase n=1 Tax=Trichonephila clavata TaxID=2740835 RepID=A0A8X6HN73_TRICU|nr:gastric triacylglycerol lipase [Trichonephila clavata]